MAKKDELIVGIGVSLLDGDDLCDGVIVRTLPGGKYEVKLDKDGVHGERLVICMADDMTLSDEDEDDVKDKVNDDDDSKDDDNDDDTITFEQTITIPQSTVTLDSLSMSEPKRLVREEAKQKELAAKRRKNRRAKLKAKPRTPIQVRKAFLAARLSKVKKRMPHTYRKEQLIAWTKEYQIIQNNKGSWSQGCVRSKKAKTAQDFIDELNID